MQIPISDRKRKSSSVEFAREKKEIEAMRRKNYAQLMGAHILLSMEECVIGMGHRSNNAATKDV
jgi:hypothetical protein